MALNRFHHLDEKKQAMILDTAAQEFYMKGYTSASINRIFQSAGISKGAGYYYFQDKEDLYVTVAEHFFLALNLEEQWQERLPIRTPRDFWIAVLTLTMEPFLENLETPWRLGVLKTIPVGGGGRLEPLLQRGQNLVKRVFAEGQKIGAVRDDLPLSLMYQLFHALNDTVDEWIVSNLDHIDDDEIRFVIAETVGGMEAIFSPRSKQ